MAAKPNKRNNSQAEKTWFASLENVALRALSKGNVPFSTLCVTFLIGIILFRTPPENIGHLIEVVLNAPLVLYTGYILLVLVSLVWYVDRKSLQKEIDRISNERNDLQKKLIPDMTSSKDEQKIIIDKGRR